MYKKILVATDGSELGSKAADSAIGLAATCGAELVALKVVPHYPQGYFEGGIALQAEDIGRVEKQWAEEAQSVVDAVVAQATTRGLKARGVTLKSDLVSEAIIQCARRQKCDLIVMASHGRRGLRRLLMGSETLAVLTHSHLPVLVLR